MMPTGFRSKVPRAPAPTEKITTTASTLGEEGWPSHRFLIIWFGVAFAGFVLVSVAVPGWYLLALFIGFLGLSWFSDRARLRIRIALTRGEARLWFILLSWGTGMALEALLPGIGGMHRLTLPSFILAQGYYWTFAIIALLLIERYRLTYWEAFFAAGMASLVEAVLVLQVIPLLLFSALAPLAPVVLAMYVTLYGMLVGVPLLFVDEETLWGASPARSELSRWRKLASGFLLLGIGTFLIAVAWFAAWTAATGDFAGWPDLPPLP